MAGRVQWEAQVDSNVAKLLKETKDLRDQLDGIKKGNYEIKLNIDNEKLEKVISNLDKMLNSLGKGTGDFKEFENLSKQLNEIVSEVKELNKAFSGINDSGVSSLLSSIQSIDKSLLSLSEHITNVNKDFESIGKNASDNVGQINEARKATEGLTDATRELANTQKNVGNKSGNEVKESVSDYDRVVSLLEEYYSIYKQIVSLGKQPTTKIGEFAEDFKKYQATFNGLSRLNGGDNEWRTIESFYAQLRKSINSGNESAMNALKYAIQNFWECWYSKNGEESANQMKLLSSDGIYLPKKYQELEASLREQARLQVEQRKSYDAEAPSVAKANKPLLERLNIIRSLIAAVGENKIITDDIFADTTGKDNFYQSDILKEFKSFDRQALLGNIDAIGDFNEILSKICTALGVEIPKASEKAQSSLKETTATISNASTTQIKDTFQGDVKESAESSAPAVKEEVKAMEQVAESAKKASKGKDEFSKANKKVKESADSSSKAVSEEATEFNKIIGKLDGYQKKLDSFKVKPTDGHRYPIYQKNINELNEYIDKLQTLSQKDINLIKKEDVSEAQALQKEIDELIFKMSKMSASEKGFDPLGADKALEKIHNELQKNSGMSKEAKRQIQGYYDEIRSGNPSKPIKDLLDDMYKLIQLEREAGRAHKSFNDIFKEKVIYGAAANMAGMIGIYDIINVGRQATDIVIDLNTQITELAKVSEDSMSQIYDDFNSYAEIAKDIGGTISDTISATSDWSRNGYSIPDSKELAKVALLYKNVGDGIDIDTANESLISTLRGFEMEAKDALDIIDVFNEVDTLASYYSNVIALCGNT